MARLMKDRNNRYLIEVAVARKYVHCIIKDGTQVRCKKYHMTKLINNSAHEGGACPYAEWWHPVPETEYPLAKAIGHFLEPMNGEGKGAGWSITDKAKAALESLRDGKAVSESELGDDVTTTAPAAVEAVTPSTSAEGESRGESDMSTKKTKSSKKSKTTKVKTNGAAKPKAEKGYKGHRAGSRKEAAHKFLDEKKPERQAFIKYCVDKKLSPATATSWYGAMHKAK